MNKEELTRKIYNYTVKSLSELFVAEVNTIDVRMFPGEIRYILEEKYNAEYCDDFDSNGWQCDFWEHFMINGNRYCLSGSAYYGNVKLSRVKDETNLLYASDVDFLNELKKYIDSKRYNFIETYNTKERLVYRKKITGLDYKYILTEMDLLTQAVERLFVSLKFTNEEE